MRLLIPRAAFESDQRWGPSMHKAILSAAILCFALTDVASAKNFAFPDKNPAATIAIPDSWKTSDIDYGYSAKSPDGDVFFSVEYAGGTHIDKMLDNNTAWMKENEIKPKGKPLEKEIEIGGLSAKVLHYDATDDTGDTMVDFLFISGGSGRLIMLTLWGSEDELKANQADIELIQKSLKAIN
jgi:hypothetical protein